MADKQVSCPHCGSNFAITEQQLQSAQGKVRCGSCLQVFDGHTGEVEFIPPVISDLEDDNPLADFTVNPMSTAELPEPPRPAPRGLLLLVTVLAGLLLFQFLSERTGNPADALSIARLVVRSHPDLDGALKLDAIVRNQSDAAQPYPALFVYFDDRYGQRHAEGLFQPDQYLSGELRAVDHIPPRTRVQFSLAFQDPGQNARNYGVQLKSVTAPAN